VSTGFQVGEVFIPLTLPPAEGGIVSPKGTSRPPFEETGGSVRVGPGVVVCGKSWVCDGVLQASQSNLVMSHMPSFCIDPVLDPMVVEASQPMAARKQVPPSSTPCPSVLFSHDPVDGLVAAYAGASVWNSAKLPTLEECMSAWDPPTLTSVSKAIPVNDSLAKAVNLGQAALEVMGDDTLAQSSPTMDGPEVMNLGLEDQLVVAQLEDAAQLALEAFKSVTHVPLPSTLVCTPAPHHRAKLRLPATKDGLSRRSTRVVVKAKKRVSNP
jgi:hypothetical protein